MHRLLFGYPLARRATPKPLRKGLGTMALLLPWLLWKHGPAPAMAALEAQKHKVANFTHLS
jgi:hypothetical protein